MRRITHAVSEQFTALNNILLLPKARLRSWNHQTRSLTNSPVVKKLPEVHGSY